MGNQNLDQDVDKERDLKRGAGGRRRKSTAIVIAQDNNEKAPT